MRIPTFTLAVAEHAQLDDVNMFSDDMCTRFGCRSCETGRFRVKLATVQRFQQQNPVLHLVIEKAQCSFLIVAGQLLNITPHLQRNSLPQHSVGLCRRPGVGCKKFPWEYPKLWHTLILYNSPKMVFVHQKSTFKNIERMLHFFIWAHVDSPPLKLGNNKFKKHVASRCSFERARRRTRSDWSHVENEPQSSRETKWPQAKNCPKEQEKYTLYMICDGTGCLVAWSIWHVQEKHCSVGKDLGGHSENSRSETIQRGVPLERSAANVSIVSESWSPNQVTESRLYGSRWNSRLKQPFTILLRKKQWTRKVIVVVGYAGNPSMETLNWRSSCFQTLLFTVFPGKNMVPLMSSMTMPFNICFMFSHLGEEVKTSVAHQEPPRCWLDSHGIAGAVLRGIYFQRQAAAVWISF